MGRGIYESCIGVVYNGTWTANGDGEGEITYTVKNKNNDNEALYLKKGEWMNNKGKNPTHVFKG